MLSQKSFRSIGDLRITSQHEQLQVHSYLKQPSKEEHYDGRRRKLSGMIVGNVDEFYLSRQNQQLEIDIMKLVDELVEEKNSQEKMKEMDVQGQKYRKIANEMVCLSKSLLARLQSSYRVSSKLAAITNCINNKNSQLQSALAQTKKKLIEVQQQIEKYRSLSVSQAKKNSSLNVELNTDPIAVQEIGIQILPSDETKQNISSQQRFHIYNTLNLTLQFPRLQSSLKICPQSSIIISVEQQQKLQTQITEEDEVAIQQIHQIQKTPNKQLTTYFKQISSVQNQVNYSEQIMQDLQKIAKHSQVAKALARLLKQHRYLKVCLEKSLETDRQAQEEHNQKILEIYHEARQSVQGRRMTEGKKQQCRIY